MRRPHPYRFYSALLAKALLALCLVQAMPASASGINKPSSRRVPSHSKKSRLNVVKSVTTETDANSSIISVFLERTPSWQRPKVRFQKNFVQVELKGITVLEPGKSYPTKSPHFKKIIPYQIKPGLAALRIYLAKPAEAYKKALSCDILGERLLVYLDHSFIASPAANAVRQERLAKEAEQVVANTTVRGGSVDPVKAMRAADKKIATKTAKQPAKKAAKPKLKGIKVASRGAAVTKRQNVATDAIANSLNYDIAAKPVASQAKAKTKAPAEIISPAAKEPLPWQKGSSATDNAKAESFYAKLQDKMKTVAIVTVFLLMLLGGVHYYRKKMASGGALAVQTPHGKLAIPSLKPLASYAIGPKQKLTLIGLHNKMILLGVSSDNIQYLYATDDANDPQLSEKIDESFRNNLGQGNTLNGRPAATNIAPRGVVRPPRTNGPAVDQPVAKPAAKPAAAKQRAAAKAYGHPRSGQPQARTGGNAAAQPAPKQVPQQRQAARAGAQAGGAYATQPQPRAGAQSRSPAPQQKRAGAQSQPNAAPGAAPEAAPRQAIEDVTSLIRKKLKDLPSI